MTDQHRTQPPLPRTSKQQRRLMMNDKRKADATF
jgi:hypothetical protein